MMRPVSISQQKSEQPRGGNEGISFTEALALPALPASAGACACCLPSSSPGPMRLKCSREQHSRATFRGDWRVGGKARPIAVMTAPAQCSGSSCAQHSTPPRASPLSERPLLRPASLHARGAASSPPPPSGPEEARTHNARVQSLQERPLLLTDQYSYG
eukprot:6202347-Pleurochrysis_carterae.AAC.6